MKTKGEIKVGEEFYPTINQGFLDKWSEKILGNYGFEQDRGIHAPLPELLKQMFEEAWVIVDEGEQIT